MDSTHRITRFRGDTLNLPISIYGGDGITPVDITGCTVSFVLDTITESTAGVVITIDGPNGSITINIPASVMATLTGSSYQFYVRVTYVDGTVETLFVATLYLQDQGAV